MNEYERICKDVGETLAIARLKANHLIADANTYVKELEELLEVLPNDSYFKIAIINSINEYYAKNPDALDAYNLAKQDNLVRTRKLPTTTVSPVIKDESHSSNKGLINVAIVIYAAINIGIILAIAIMK